MRLRSLWEPKAVAPRCALSAPNGCSLQIARQALRNRSRCGGAGAPALPEVLNLSSARRDRGAKPFSLWGATGPLVSVAGSRRGRGTADLAPGNSSTSETNSTPRDFGSSNVFWQSSVSIVIDAGGRPIAGSACPGVPGQRASWKSSPRYADGQKPRPVGLSNALLEAKDVRVGVERDVRSLTSTLV